MRESQLAQLEKTLARLSENVTAAKASLDALTIRAPTDGRLTALEAEVGQSKSAGAELGQVASLDRFKLTAQVDEFYLGRVALGQTALFTADGRDYEQAVNKIHHAVDKHPSLRCMRSQRQFRYWKDRVASEVKQTG